MGVVYLAEQDTPLRRRVALKVVKQGMDTREVIGRFESERQALAMMNHPNIARAFDAGTTDEGRPYFVMEHVQGIPITDYCDKHRLTPKERLELYIPVCQAIHHAHQNGIIHRDIKPSNILARVQDGKPVATVIDFGVAKALNQRLTAKTVFTEQGRLIGTPAYMSPEQAEMTGLGIDTTTDVYSLGAVLYELLTGHRPFEDEVFRAAGRAAMEKMIREVDPPKPSTRVSTRGGDGQGAASRRRVDLKTLERELRGDLDWITMRAMEKDRTRRYQSALELGADLDRHLRQEPVSAGPPSAGYRMTKFATRHRGPVAAGAAVFVALVFGMSLATAMYFRSERARRDADSARRRAEWREYVSHIQAAGVFIEANQSLQARTTLEKCAPLLRRWEWRYLMHRIDQSLRTFRGHTGLVAGVSFSPDGRKLASASSDSTIRIWDVSSGRCLQVLEGHTGWVSSVAFSPDGEQLASASFDSTFRIWSAQSGKLLRTYGPGKAWIWHVAYSPDGKRLAAAGDSIRIVDGSGLVTSLPLRSSGSAVAFMPDGQQLIFDMGRRVKGYDEPRGYGALWDFKEAKPVRYFHTKYQDRPMSLAVSADGRSVAMSYWENWDAQAPFKSRVWNAATGKEDQLLVLPASASVLRFSQDDRRLIAGLSDGTIRIVDRASGESRGVLRGHVAEVVALASSGDGRLLASGAADWTVKLWSVTPEDSSIRIPDRIASKGQPMRFALSTDGRKLAVGMDTLLCLWDFTKGVFLESLAGHKKGIAAVAVGPDNATIATASEDSTVKIWDWDDRACLATLRGHQGGVVNLAFSRDGKQLVSASPADSATRVWDVGGRRQLLMLKGYSVSGVAYSRDTNRMVTASGDGTVRVWSAAGDSESVMTFGAARPPTLTVGGKTMGEDEETLTIQISGSPDLRTTTSYSCVAVSSTEDLLACGRWDGTVDFIALKSKRVTRWNYGHGGCVRWLAFSPDGSRLATCSDDMTIRIVDVASAEEVLVLKGHQGPVECVAFTPDGNTLISSSRDGTIRLWR